MAMMEIFGMVFVVGPGGHAWWEYIKSKLLN